MSEEIFLEQKAFLSKLAKESGKIRCAIRTGVVYDATDSGWQFLEGTESELYLADPGNGLLISLRRAVELEPKLLPILQEPCGQFRYQEQNGTGMFSLGRVAESEAQYDGARL